MPGLRQALSRISDSANRPNLRMEQVDPEQIAMKTLELYGNSEIGMVANWQAMLNHGGYLDLDTMFSMSEVIDAVNYRSGHIEPVLSGLKSRAIETLLSGKKLPSGTPLNRIFGQLAKEWKNRGLEVEHGPLIKSEISERIDWYESVVKAMDQVVEKLIRFSPEKEITLQRSSRSLIEG